MNLDIKAIERDLGWKRQLASEKEKKGYKLLEEIKINCPNCSQPLLTIVKVKESDKINRIQAICPVCDEETYWETIEGEIYIGPAQSVSFANVDTQIINNTHQTLIKVIK